MKNHIENKNGALFGLLCAILLATGCYFANARDSPYRLTCGREVPLLGGGGLNALFAYSLEKKVAPSSPAEIAALSRDYVNFFDRSATNNYSPNISAASDILAGAIIVSPVGLLVLDDCRGDWLVLSTMYAETMLWAASAASYAKAATTRYRPFAYNSGAPLDEKLVADARLSFFSAHACFAFASASFVSTVWSEYFPESKYSIYIYGGAYAAAGTVGLLRVLSGKHFPTDVLTGAAIGTIIGCAIPALHIAKNNASQSMILRISPYMVALDISF